MQLARELNLIKVDSLSVSGTVGIRTAFTGDIRCSHGNFLITIKYFNENTQTFDYIHDLSVNVIDSDIDLIVGKPTIKQTDLLE
jgi:hypothetical protein